LKEAQFLKRATGEEANAYAACSGEVRLLILDQYRDARRPFEKRGVNFNEVIKWRRLT